MRSVYPSCNACAPQATAAARYSSGTEDRERTTDGGYPNFLTFTLAHRPEHAGEIISDLRRLSSIFGRSVIGPSPCLIFATSSNRNGSLRHRSSRSFIGSVPPCPWWPGRRVGSSACLFLPGRRSAAWWPFTARVFG